jgi:hypothetical protein
LCAAQNGRANETLKLLDEGANQDFKNFVRGLITLSIHISVCEESYGIFLVRVDLL